MAENDSELLELLAKRCGLKVFQRTEHGIADDGQFDVLSEWWDMERTAGYDYQHAIEILDIANRPATADELGVVLAKMDVLSAGDSSTNTVNVTRLTLESYKGELMEFPADVVGEACRLVLRECKWFPALEEIVGMIRSVGVHRFAITGLVGRYGQPRKRGIASLGELTRRVVEEYGQ